MSLTYANIETRVMNSLRLSTGNAVEQAKVQNLINMVYRDIAAKKDWWWLLKRTAINTVAKQTPTANLTNNSTVVTLSSAMNASILNYVMIVPGASDDWDAVYRFTSNTATVNQTLDAAYTNPSNTAASVRIYQDAIPLPTDCSKVINVKRYGEFQPMRRMGIEDISQYKLTDQQEGKPEMYAVFDTVTTGDPTTQRMLQIHPYPDKLYRLEIYYKRTLNTELTGSTVPLIPDDYAEILYYGAMARGYATFLDDDTRSKFFQALFNDLLALMTAQQNEYASDKSGIIPDMASYRPGMANRMRQPYTLGSWFDRLPSDR